MVILNHPRIAGVTLTRDCPACGEARHLITKMSAALGKPANLAVPAAIDCRECDNRGVILTDTGRTLLEFLRDWQ